MFFFVFFAKTTVSSVFFIVTNIAPLLTIAYPIVFLIFCLGNLKPKVVNEKNTNVAIGKNTKVKL
jgi:hypothetical protein